MWQIYRYYQNQTFDSDRVTYINTINSLVDCP